MNVNEIVTQLQNIDLSVLFSQNTEAGHALSGSEMIIFAVIAAAGVLLCLFGLKIVRFWAAVFGLLAGFTGGFLISWHLGVEDLFSLIIGLAAGLILAVLGIVLYRVGIFLTVFLSVGILSVNLLNPQDWVFLGICLGIGLVAAVLSIWFAMVITILATSLFGAVILGNALSVLVPVIGSQSIIRIAVIAAAAVIGILVQLLLESGKRKKRNLKKAAEIREHESTENEVERARAMFEDAEGPAETETEGSAVPQDDDETFLSLDEFEDDLDDDEPEDEDDPDDEPEDEDDPDDEPEDGDDPDDEPEDENDPERRG